MLYLSAATRWRINVFIFSLFVWFTITILSYTVIAFILAVCRPTVCVLYCLYGVINDDDDNTVLLYSLNPKFCKENVKNCMLISHFALASGDFVPQTPYRDFAPGPTGDFRYPDPLPPPTT